MSTESRTPGLTIKALLVPLLTPLVKARVALAADFVTVTLPVQAPLLKSGVVDGAIVPAEKVSVPLPVKELTVFSY